MNKKSQFLFHCFFILLTLFFIEIGYLYASKSLDKTALYAKREFVKLVQLPDLAIATEASYVRHRSLSDFFSIYKDDAALREYFASTYVFSDANIQKSKDEK